MIIEKWFNFPFNYLTNVVHVKFEISFSVIEFKCFKWNLIFGFSVCRFPFDEWIFPFNGGTNRKVLFPACVSEMNHDGRKPSSCTNFSFPPFISIISGRPSPSISRNEIQQSLGVGGSDKETEFGHEGRTIIFSGAYNLYCWFSSWSLMYMQWCGGIH